jgi:DNA helicase-2/ATP-dependent DNA helicase PcrA
VVFLVGMEEGIFPHSRSMGSREEIEEERRLCYVGMTRAKDELYLSYASVRSWFGNRERQVVSRFVREIPPYLFRTSDSTTRAKAVSSAMSSVEFEARPKQEVAKCSFKPGDYVKHNLFGLGIVENVEPNASDVLITVAFEEVGRKKLMLSYAGLEKVEIW